MMPGESSNLERQLDLSFDTNHVLSPEDVAMTFFQNVETSNVWLQEVQ